MGRGSRGGKRAAALKPHKHNVPANGKKKKDTFFIYTKYGAKPVSGSVFKAGNLEVGIHRDLDNSKAWTISELSTGARIVGGRTMREATDRLMSGDILSRAENIINNRNSNANIAKATKEIARAYQDKEKK